MSSAHITKAGVVVIMAIALGGCYVVNPEYTDRRETIALSAGDAIATNKMTQMVDPWSRASAHRNITFDGQKMQSAVERYRTNKVIKPVNATTSSAPYQQAQPGSAAPTNGNP